MGNSIKISEKYGLNPTIPCCFFCGEQKNEVALLGRLDDPDKGEDIEAPRNAVLDYEPCENCKKKFSLGVLVIEVTFDHPKDMRPAISKDPTGAKVYPTGNYVVVRRGVLNVDGDKCLMNESVFKRLFSDEMNK